MDDLQAGPGKVFEEIVATGKFHTSEIRVNGHQRQGLVIAKHE
tara:strand:+ start:1779 stop:1907 length:129 start_codon:yes stop_codon:yes gene_type:complete